MVMMPQARPKRVDLVFARPRPIETIAIAVIETDSGYRYAGVGEDRSFSGVLPAPNAEVAVLDAIDAICAEYPGRERIRFIANLGSASPLWRYVGQIHIAATDWWIERPSHTDRPLIAAAVTCAQTVCPAPAELPPALVDGGPLTVATDGSVRGTFAGFGWLTSAGDYGLAGYCTSSKRVGSEKVLVAELRAIGAAVCALPRHQLTVLSDSQCAVAIVDAWKRGEPTMPPGYPADDAAREHSLNTARQRIRRDRNRIEVRWAPGHHGEPLNEGADTLARLGSRHRRGDRDLDDVEYHRRAAGIAQAFAAEYRRTTHVQPATD